MSTKKKRSKATSAGMLLLGLGQVAKMLGVSRTTAWRLTRSGKLPAVQVGKQLRVRWDDLQEWLEAGGSA